MNTGVVKLMAGALLALSCTAHFAQSASAQANYSGYTPAYYYNPYSNPYNPYYSSYRRPSVFSAHPILTGTLLGTAVGAAGGAAVGALQKEDGHSGSNIGAGAAIGAGAGAALGVGVGLLRNRHITGSWF